jgi:hypothetical protein
MDEKVNVSEASLRERDLTLGKKRCHPFEGGLDIGNPGQDRVLSETREC